MAKRLILLFLVLFLIPFINADIYKQDSDVNITISCSDTNCSEDTNITIFYPNSHIVIDNEIMSSGSGFVVYNFQNTSEIGIYKYISSQGYEGTFEITYYGISLSTSQSILYGFFFLVFVFFMVSIIFIINALPASNTQDEEGKILSISYLKYFRSSLWFVEWMLLVGLLYISSNVAFAYLPEQLFAQALFMLFRITFLLTPVILVVWIIWIFVKMFHDKQLQKLLNRGFFPQGRI